MERIKSIKASDSAVKLFIKTIEPLNIIKWKGFTVEEVVDGNVVATEKKINDEATLNLYIEKYILPNFLSRIQRDRNNSDYLDAVNYYMKDIDVEEEYRMVRENNIFAPEIEEAYKIYNRADAADRDPTTPTNRERARLQLLNYYNNIKQDNFESWLQTINAIEEIQKRPALKYLILKSVFDLSDETKKNPVPSANYAVIEQMVSRIDNIKWEYGGKIKDENMRKSIVSIYKSVIKENNEKQKAGLPQDTFDVVLMRVKQSIPEQFFDEKEIIEIIKTQQSVEAYTQKIEVPNPNYDELIEANPTAKNKVPKTIKTFKTPEQITAELSAKIPGLAYANEDVAKILQDHYSPELDIAKQYKSDLIAFSERISKKYTSKKESDWVHIPQYGKDGNGNPLVDENGQPMSKEKIDAIFDARLEELDAYSNPNNWCTTKNRNGPYYLKDGDFYIYKEKGRAYVAIRFWNNNIYEIAGDQSKFRGAARTAPIEHWKEVVDFVKSKGWVGIITPNSPAAAHWNILLEQKNLNESFFNDDGTPNLEEIEEEANRIEKEPTRFKIFEKNETIRASKFVYGKLRNACKIGWKQIIESKTGAASVQFIESILDKSADIPDFLLEDPDFVESIHGNLAKLYSDNPRQLKVVLQKVPTHLEMYPRGRKIFIDAVINLYRDGFHWVATAYGANKKDAQSRAKIQNAQKENEEICSIIAQHFPELIDNQEFITARNEAKEQSITAALTNGFVSEEMPIDTVNAYIIENIAQLSKTFSDKIVVAKKPKAGIKTPTDIFKENRIQSFMQSIMPPKYRKSSAYTQLIDATRKKVLLASIEFYSQFDEKYKNDPDLYNAYKRLILPNLHIFIRDKKLDEIDSRLKSDQDYATIMQEMGRGEDLDKISKIIKSKPSVFLTLTDELKESVQVQDVYLASRCIDKVTTWRQVLLKEWMDSRMPLSFRQRQDAREKYKEYLLWSINNVALTNSPYFVKCTEEDIDAEFLQLDEIQEACEKRTAKMKKAVGWYCRLVLS